MNIEVSLIYIITINIIAFVLYYTYNKFTAHKESTFFSAVLLVVSLLGGSLGVIISSFFFKNHSNKATMLVKVLSLCFLLIQIALFVMFKLKGSGKLNLDFIGYFSTHNIVLIYLGIINVITFIAFGIDKRLAVKHRSRVPIATLFALSFIGGSIGGLLAMRTFRHKTRKSYFTLGIPTIIIMQIVLIVVLMNL